ncbi:uncharacterized protein LOC111301983 [Durio zibethinus]|uniref:Uncharacterized protein LOC111301983 n=1 Tax=Durio zibethinus TaxID=66656 RepID=A0A6P5ZMQ8_DURZI|nr:uncharacterized protein LOC111301983 [Durio zibethinus]
MRAKTVGKEIVTMFVNNLPDNIHWIWLTTIFQRFGYIVDVFIPRNRSKTGKRFGFVRFTSFEEAKKAVLCLNGVWLVDHKIDANIARFAQRNSFWRKRKVPEAKAEVGTRVTERTETNSNNPECEKLFHYEEESYMGEINNETLHWLSRTVVGVSKCFTKSNVISEQFKMEGVFGLNVRKLSVKQFLINFDNTEMFEGMKNDE